MNEPARLKTCSSQHVTAMNYGKRMTDQLPRKPFDGGHKEQRTRRRAAILVEGGRQEALSKIPPWTRPH